MTVTAGQPQLLNQIGNSTPNLGASSNCVCQKGDIAQNTGENPHPIISTEYIVPTNLDVPELFKAQLTFGGIPGPEVWYSGNGVQKGEVLRFVLQADATTLATGFYPWTMSVTAYRGGQGTTNSISGIHAVFNRINSPFGNRWWVPELDVLKIESNGVGLIRGDSTGAWFIKDAQGNYITPAGSYSALVKNADNTYTLSYPDGYKQNFGVTGLLTSRVDANNNTTTYEYIDANGDGQANEIFRITNPFGQQIGYSYQNGLLASKTDYFGQTLTYQHDGNGRLTQVIGADPDSAGPLPQTQTTFGYNGLGLLSSISKNNTTTSFAYDFARRFDVATMADGKTWKLDPVQTQGLVDLSTGQGTQANPAPVFRPHDAVASYTNELGHTWKIRVDAFGNILESTDPLGSFTRWERDEHGRVVRRRDPDPDGPGPLTAPFTQYRYDEWGNLTRIVNPDGSARYFFFQAGTSRMTSMVDELGRGTSYGYDAAGNRISEKDALGNTTYFYYTARGQVSQIAYPDPDGAGPLTAPHRWFQYDTFGRLIKATNPDGTYQEFHYDVSGNLDWQKDELGQQTTFVHDAVGRLTQTTDPRGATTTNTYNSLGQLFASPTPWATRPITPTTCSVAWSRRSVPIRMGPGRLAARSRATNTTRRGSSSRSPMHSADYVYDRAGRQTHVYQPAPDIGQPRPYTITAYDRLGRVIALRDPLARVSDFHYDIASRLILVVAPDPDGPGGLARPQTQTTYYANGLVKDTIDPFVRTTHYNYDGANRLIDVTLPDPDGAGPLTSPIAVYHYDNLGRADWVQDPRGNKTYFTYDINSRLAQTKNALNDIASFTYDRLGRVRTQTDELGHLTRFKYENIPGQGERVYAIAPDPDGMGPLNPPFTVATTDLLGRETTFVNERGITTHSFYDNLSRLTKRVDAEGRLEQLTTKWGYDPLGNVINATNPFGFTTQVFYDRLNRPVRVVDAKNQSTWTAYDVAGKVTQVTYPDPDGAGPRETPSTLYIYNNVDWLTKVRDPDPDGTGPLARPETQYQYNLVANVTRVIDSLGRFTDTTYDNLDRPLTVTEAVGTPLARTTSFKYDANNNRWEVTDPAGTITRITFDVLNRPTHLIEAYGTPKERTTVTEYDKVGNVTKITDPLSHITRFEYDPLDRRTKTIDARNGETLFTYDAAGNLTGLRDPALNLTTFDYDALNRLVRETDAAGAARTFGIDVATNSTWAIDRNGRARWFEYDAVGRLREEIWIDGVGNRVRTIAFFYNPLDELTYAYDPDSTYTSAGTVVEEVSFKYDLFDRRIAKTVDLDGAGPGVATTERFVYDGDQVALVFDGASSLTNRYLWGSQIDQLLADEQVHLPANDLFWALTDHLGSVRDVVDSSATLLKHIAYDSFGKVAVDTNPALKVAYGYTGREFEATIGLQYSRARWYDHAAGRWVSVDPIKDGVNWYAYVENRVLAATDPSGLDALEAADRWVNREARRRYDKHFEEMAWGVMAGNEAALNELRWWTYARDDYEAWVRKWTRESAQADARAMSPVYDRAAEREVGTGSGKKAAPGGLDSSEITSLVWDVIQFGLDVGGIFEPTPFCDISSGLISLGRGDWLGDGISALAMIPYVGDVAKAAKFPKYVSSVRRALTVIRKSEGAREALRPLLVKLNAVLSRVPLDCPPKGLESAAEQVKSIRKELSAALEETGSKTPVMAGTPSGPHGGGHGPSGGGSGGSGGGSGSSGGGGGYGGTPNGVPNPNAPRPVVKSPPGANPRATNELPPGQGRTKPENDAARQFYENHKDKAKQWWEDRTGQTWPSDASHAHHPRAIKDGGDPLFVRPGYGGSNAEHMIPRPEYGGKTDAQRWGEMGGRPRRS